VTNQNKKIYGSKSEQIEGQQILLFDEIDCSHNLKVEEPTIEEIQYKR